MPQITANNIQLEYEEFGDPTAPPVLMIMGLGAQLTMWSDEFIERLVSAGYRVIIFDNRDIGLSHPHTGETPPGAVRQTLMRRIGIRLKTPYSLMDMAKDAIGLMDALDLSKVHLVGVSMGGMIAQHVAAIAPDRIASLTAIMTTTGNPKLPRPAPHIMKTLIRRGPQPTQRDDIIDATIASFGVIGTPGEDHNSNGMRERVARSYDRNHSPAGVARHMAAIIAAGDFRKVTRRIKAPTLVVHGSVDPLVPVEGGQDIAKLVRGARIEIIDGMGHDLPPRFMPVIAQHIVNHFSATKIHA